MEKKRKRSEVWKVFMEVPDSNPPLVKCSICNSTLKYYKNTTNLKQHIQFHNQNQEPRIDDILLQLFTSTLLPLTLIQNEYFIHFVDSLNPKAKLPSYKTFANKIEQLYEEKKLFCKKKLLDITIGSLMIDGWSNNSNCFLGLIFHYIKTDWTIESMLLEFTVFNERHTGDNISLFIENVIIEWNLQNKIIAIISDNAANMIKGKESPNIFNIRCAIHTLHLAILKAIDNNCNNIIEKSHKIINFIKRSTKTQQKLKYIMIDQLQKDYYTLKLSNQTRWNSIYFMIERLIQTKLGLIILFETEHEELKFKNEEWDELNDLYNILKLCYTTSLQWESEKKGTLSLVIPMIFYLIQTIQTISIKTENVKNFIITLIYQLQKRKNTLLKNNKQLYFASSFLDIKFKNLEFLSNFLILINICFLKTLKMFLF